MATMMWRAFLCLLFLACSQVSSKMPSKEKLCNTIVDKNFQRLCLDCFTDAGSLGVNPEAVRYCVATYLPPVLAECSVPHHERKSARIQIQNPLHHHNHTNANLLPNCLKRGMRVLSRYLHKENLFTKYAGQIVKAVVSSNLIPDGGANMLSITSLCYILQDSAIQDLVEMGASSCLQEYNNTCTPFANEKRPKRYLEVEDSVEDFNEDDDDDDVILERATETRDPVEDFDEYDEDDDAVLERATGIKSSVEDLDHDSDEDDVFRGVLKLRAPESSLKEEQNEEEGDEGEDERRNWDDAALRKKRPVKGNGLPYGGTSPLAEDMMLGTCIIESLIENDLGLNLINVITDDDFFYPIPSMWVEPLIRFYKEARETLENEEDI